MLDEQTREVVVRSARTAQIITVALCLGVTVFAGVVLAQRGVGGEGNLGILTMTAMVLTVAGVPAGFLVGQQITRTARSRLLGDTEAAQDQKGRNNHAGGSPRRCLPEQTHHCCRPARRPVLPGVVRVSERGSYGQLGVSRYLPARHPGTFSDGGTADRLAGTSVAADPRGTTVFRVTLARSGGSIVCSVSFG